MAIATLNKGAALTTPPPVLLGIADVVTYIVGGGATRRERRLCTYRVYNMTRGGVFTGYYHMGTGARMWDLHEVDPYVLLLK